MDGPVISDLVVIVEDDAATREFIRVVLEDEGYRITEVERGEDALAAIVGEPPCLILCDMVLPPAGGERVIRALKANLATARIPIVGISAGGPAQEERAMAAGCDGFLAKPFDLDDLLAVVQRVCPPRR